MSKLYLVPVVLIALASLAFGQTAQTPAAEPKPAPKPTVKRRGLDQFGLSRGVLSSSGNGSSASYESGATSVSEPVDQKLIYLLSSVADHLRGLETGYRLAYEKRKEPRYGGLMPERYVFDHLRGSFTSPAALREGVFEGDPFKNPSNAALFEDLRFTMDDLMTATSRMQRDYATNAGSTAIGLVQKYSVPTFENEIGQSMLMTRDLIFAIFARAQKTLTRLERQIVAR